MNSDKKQLTVQLSRVFLCCVGISEGSAAYVQYFASFLFDIDTSTWFYVYRIVTNLIFFSARLLAITAAFYYYKIAVYIIISGHFFIYYLITYFYQLNSNNSKFTNLFISLYIVCFKMLTVFEDFQVNVVLIYFS